MLIIKNGDSTKETLKPKNFEYIFECYNCGCVFRESGENCDINHLYSWNDEIVDTSVTHICPNCEQRLRGERII